MEVRGITNMTFNTISIIVFVYLQGTTFLLHQ